MNKRLKIIKDVDQDPNYPWVKSVCIRSLSGPYFPAFGLIRRDTPFLSIFTPHSGKYGPEKLQKDTFH